MKRKILLTFGALFVLLAVGVVAADAPYVTLWTNGGPASTANPLAINCVSGCSASAGPAGVNLQTSPTPVPQTGYAALSAGLFIGPSPWPTATAYVPAAINVTTSGCSGNPATWGTTGSGLTIQGVTGEVLGAGCNGIPVVTVDHLGTVGIKGTTTVQDLFTGTSGCAFACGLTFSFNSCALKTTGSGVNILVGQSGGSNNCSLSLQSLSANTFVCASPDPISASFNTLVSCGSQVLPVANGGTGTTATPSPMPSPASGGGCLTTGAAIACSGYGAQAVSTPFPIASAATGTTGNTYQTLVTDTVTLGTSYGPQGKWFGTVTMDLWVALGVLNATQANYGCITTASTVTTISRTNASTTTPCNTAASGSIAGTSLFGSTLVASGAGADSHAMWTGTAANGASLTFVCQVAASGTTSVTIYGSCPSWWIPI